MTTQEMIEVMQAYTRGETIEVSDKGAGNWSEIKCPLWDWNSFKYRVKPKKPKFKDTDFDLMIWKTSEAEPLHPKTGFYQSSYIKERDDKDVNNYVHFDDVLWYWEYQDADGHWKKSDYRATRAEIEKLSNFHNFSPLYALGFRVKDTK